MYETILPQAFAGLFSYLITRMLIPIAPTLGLMDVPSARKKHSGSIPLVGGIAIYATVLICSLLFSELDFKLLSIISIGGILAAIGSLDDKYNISPNIRLTIQICAGIILAVGAGVQLRSLGDLFGLGVITLGLLTVPCTALGIAALANAYNMTDGIDGLAASLGIVAFTSFIIALDNSLNKTEFLVLSFYILSLSVYLVFNFSIKPLAPQKVFMGDAGSMFIGFSIAAFAIYFSQSNRFDLAPTTVIWFVAIPLFDMFATMIRRMRKGQNPFYPDRTHLHHLLMHLGLTQNQALVTIITSAITLSLIGLSMNTSQEAFSFFLFLSIFFCYLFFMIHIWKIKKYFPTNHKRNS